MAHGCASPGRRRGRRRRAARHKWRSAKPRLQTSNDRLMKTWQPIVLTLLVAGDSASLFGGMAVGPDYRRPSTPASTNFADTALGAWKEAVPADAIARGDWWRLYNDPVLDELERQAAENNQDLKAAIARVTQARALAREAKAGFFPRLSLVPSMNRRRESPNALNPAPDPQGNQFAVPFDLSYELDL